MPKEETYCVKEKKFTKNVNPIVKISQNGKKYLQSTCVICGNKKTSFIKNDVKKSNNITKKLKNKKITTKKNKK